MKYGARFAILLAVVAVVAVLATGSAVLLSTPELRHGRYGVGDRPCPDNTVRGTLVAVSDYGTALTVGTERTILVWPPGYTARRSWLEVEVLDRDRNVVARIGQEVQLHARDGSYFDPTRDTMPTSVLYVCHPAA